MSESKFVYVTYIRTTPDKLWRALTAPEFTRQYWAGFHDAPFSHLQSCQVPDIQHLAGVADAAVGDHQTGESLEATRKWPEGV